MNSKEQGASADADRATPASPEAPAGLRHSGGIASAERDKYWLLGELIEGDIARHGACGSSMVRSGLLRLILTERAELLSEGSEALDTMVTLRADLAEEEGALHAQRIAVLDLSIAALTAAIARATGAA